jgi:hypothetical protein
MFVILWQRASMDLYEPLSVFYKDFSSNLCVQTSSKAHPASYPMVLGMTVETLVQAPDRSFPYRPIN